MDAYLGLDLGGTGVKAGVYDKTGKQIGFGAVKYTPETPAIGRAELPIEVIYNASKEAVRKAIIQSDARVKSMSISSQGQAFVSLDKNDMPLHPAIIWYDSRGAEHFEKISDFVCSNIRPEDIPEINPIAVVPKILDLRLTHPVEMAKAVKHLLLPEYFSYKLTGRAVTDPSTASSTGAYAEDAPNWCELVFDYAGIDKSSFAEIQMSGTPIGKILPKIAEEWMLDSETLLVVGCNDQYAGAIGAGNCRTKIVSETTGTCLALVTLIEKLPTNKPAGIIFGRFPIKKYQFALAYSKTAGVVLEWFVKNFGNGLSFDDFNEMAKLIPIGCDGVTVLPHFEGTISPFTDANARGFICNLTLQNSPAHIYRAIMESLSFFLKENLDYLTRQGFEIDIVRSIGGGAKSDLWLQMKADVTNLPVEKPLVSEAATFGGAMIAAVGVGDYSSIEESSENLYRAEKVFEPNSEFVKLYQSPYQRYLDICKTAYGWDKKIFIT